MKKLRMDSIRSVAFETYFANDDRLGRRLAFVTSGYERRASYWTSLMIERGLLRKFACVDVIGFHENADSLSRVANNSFYSSNGLNVEPIENDNKRTFAEFIGRRIAEERAKSHGVPLEVHVDYSCMPRSWYCELPAILNEAITKEEVACLWYSRGRYHGLSYPSAGVNDFQIFSGVPSLDPKRRAHVFGLGFDKIRSHAIWSVLEPKHLVCFYAGRGSEVEYQKKVVMDNRDILAASAFSFEVPLDDFVSAFSQIRSVVLDLRMQGDVIIVPDGPKQLIMASSLVPPSLDGPGVICFHVRRRKDPDIQIVDADGAGMPTGFLMYGAL